MRNTTSTDDWIEQAIASGKITADPDTGQVYRHGKPLNLKPDAQGYISVCLGVRKYVKGHRIVWTAANGRIPEGMHINHVNGVRHDNRLVNLELVTPAENIGHAHGTLSYNRVRPLDVAHVAEDHPEWFAQLRALAEQDDVTPEQIAELRQAAYPEKEPSVYANGFLRNGVLDATSIR